MGAMYERSLARSNTLNELDLSLSRFLALAAVVSEWQMLLLHLRRWALYRA